MSNQPRSSSGLARGYTIALLASIVFSSTGVLIRYLTQNYELPALVLAFWRDIFAGSIILTGLAIFRPALLKIRQSQLVYLIFFGFIFALFNSFWTISVSLNGASVATVLSYCSPAFSAILGVWLLNEKMDAFRILTIVICLGGCVLVANAYNPEVWNSNLGGIITGLISGLTYALYALFGRKAAQRNIHPLTSLAYIFFFAATILLVFNVLFCGFLPGTATSIRSIFPNMALSGWGILLLLAAGPTMLGYILCNYSLVYLSPNLTNLILTSEPVFTAIISYFLLSEKLTSWQIVGTLMILGAVVLLRVHEGHKEKMARQCLNGQI